MSNWSDHKYRAKDMTLQADLREHGNSLGEKREDILDSMLNLILNHKKELQKVPACTTLAGAKAWCEKRPGSGFRAGLDDVGGDPESEVVVYDKSGKPFIVNGYKLKPSDYGIRKLYREAIDKDPEGMIGTSMRDWVTNQAWSTQESKENKWDLRVTKNTDVYDRMKGWGYRMPSKPKALTTPYSIFSKLIAPIVRDVLTEGDIYNRLASVFGLTAVAGPECLYFFNKIVSPISVYRFLYLRLIEQKFYWSVKQSPATKNINTFERFKKYIKDNKATFRQWFFKHIMTGERKENLSSAWCGKGAVLDNLVKQSIQLDGSDIQDGIVFMLGVKNLADQEPVEFRYKGKDIRTTFRELLTNNNAATIFNTVLKAKKDSYSKVLKRRLDRWRKASEASIKAYFKDDRAKKLFFDDEVGMQTFLAAIQNAGLPNATDPGSAARQSAGVSSPVRQPPVVEPAPQDEGVSVDDEGLPAEFFEDDADSDGGEEAPRTGGRQRTLDEMFGGSA